MTEKEEVNAVCKLGASEKLQMLNQDIVTKMEEERLDQDLCQKVKVSDFYVELENEFIERFSDSETM